MVRWITVSLWVLVLLQASLVTVAVVSLPWMAFLPGWYVPAIIVIGALAGGVALWRWSVASVLVVVGVALSVAAVVTAVALAQASVVLDTTPVWLTGGVVVLLLGLSGVVVGRLGQPVLVLVPVWLVVLGVSHYHLSGVVVAVIAPGGVRFGLQADWWLSLLLVSSVALMALVVWRERALRWERLHLALLGPVGARAMGAVLALVTTAAAMAALPLSVNGGHWLDRWWQRTPLAAGTALRYVDQSGAPQLYAGAPLNIQASPEVGDQILMNYQVLAGTLDPAINVFVASFDTFDDSTWRQSPWPVVTVDYALPVPAGAPLVRVRYVLAAPPPATVALLPALGQPEQFSVPVAVQAADAPVSSVADVADWQSRSALAVNATYIALSAAGPSLAAADDSAAGVEVPASVVARYAAVPTQRRTQLAAFVAALGIPTAGTSATRAQVLLDQLRTRIAVAPAGAVSGDPLAMALTQRRASPLVLTTLYVLAGRMLGLPLRLAEGYLTGQTFTDTDGVQLHRVRASDATVWAQLAVPGAGWVDVFPAGHERVGESAGPVAATKVTPTASAGESAGVAPVAKAPAASVMSLNVVVWVVLGLLGGVLAVLVVGVVRWQRLGVGHPWLVRTAARLVVLGTLAGVRLRPSDTASEVVKNVAAVVPEHRATLDELAEHYNRAVYAQDADGTGWPVWQAVRQALARQMVRRIWRREKGTRQ